MDPHLLGSIISPVVFVAVIGGLAYGVFAVARGRSGRLEIDPGIGTIRRLYFYIVSFVALLMAAIGIAQTLSYLLENIFGGDVLSRSTTGLAWGLATTIVGVPLWAFHWRTVQQHVRRLPVEARSVLRKLYIYLVLGVAAGFVIASLVSILGLAFRTQSFNGFAWAALVVWSGIWVYHWRLEEAEGQPTPETQGIRRLYIYLTAVVTLSMAAVGFGQVIHGVLMEGYEALTSLTVLTPAQSGLWRTGMRESLAVALASSPVWAGHWFYLAGREYGSMLRQLYLYVFALMGSVVTLLVSAALVLYGVLVWSFGVPDEPGAAMHFRFVPGALASAMIGTAILAYHASVARRQTESPTLESRGAQGSYPYALAALGLVTLAIGIAVMVSLAIGLLAERGQVALAGRDLWRNSIALSIALGALGAPMWAYFWRSIQQQVGAGDGELRTRLARRVFIFALLGAGMLALLGSGSFLIFVFFRELLDGQLADVLADAKVSIGIIAAVGIFLPYYWMVYRVDRRLAPADDEARAKAGRRKAVTALVGEEAVPYLQQLEAALGYGVSPLRWADPDAVIPDLTEDDVRDLAQRVGDASGPNVLLVPDGADIRVLSYH